MTKKQRNPEAAKMKNTKQGNLSTRTGIERMFKILGILQNGDIDRNPINCKKLGAILEVDRATVMRDIAFLRDRLGVEFEWDAEEKTYRLYGDTKYLPCMELNDIDKLVLEYLSQAMQAVGGSELGAAMEKSFQRLVSIFTGKYPKNGWEVSVNFPQKPGASELRVYHLSTRAIRSGKCIRVVCKTGLDGNSTSVELNPAGLEFCDGRWVLKAVLAGSRESVRLALSEILQIDIAQEPALPVSPLWSDPRPAVAREYPGTEQNHAEFSSAPPIAA
jgi:predicted DNA-binding transcriptional regulator YafY